MAKKKESKQKKINVRVDFTPMVDMLMLLITFFMLCTTLSKPSSMELFLPSNDKNIQDDQKNEAKASETITMYIAADNKLYYGEGIPDYNNADWIKETTWTDQGIRDVLRNHVTENGMKPVNHIIVALEKLEQDRKLHPEKFPIDSIYQKEVIKIKGGEIDGQKIPTLTVVIKPTDNSTYQDMINALNEMQILSIGKYVIDKITPDDEKLLNLKGVKM